jgi:hypothetical protein
MADEKDGGVWDLCGSVSVNGWVVFASFQEDDWGNEGQWDGETVRKNTNEEPTF